MVKFCGKTTFVIWGKQCLLSLWVKLDISCFDQSTKYSGALLCFICILWGYKVGRCCSVMCVGTGHPCWLKCTRIFMAWERDLSSPVILKEAKHSIYWGYCMYIFHAHFTSNTLLAIWDVKLTWKYTPLRFSAVLPSLRWLSQGKNVNGEYLALTVQLTSTTIAHVKAISL